MAYVACANCGNLNKEGEPTCYSCGQEMVAAPPPPPPSSEPPPSAENPWAANLDVRVQPLSPKTGDPSKARFQDLASRYDARTVPQTNANVLHGLRSGLPAGLLTGVLMGFYRKYQVDDMTRLAVRKYPHMPKHGGEMMAYSVGFDLILGLLLGIVLGMSNLLCFPFEAARTGAILGAFSGALLLWLAGTGFESVVIGVVQGAIMGTLASLIERKLFRGQ